MKLWIASLVCVLGVSSPGFSADKADNTKLLNEVVSSLREEIQSGKLSKRLSLDIQVKAGTVRVSGRVEDKDESRAVLNSVLNVNGVQGIQLNLGVGREPTRIQVTPTSLSENRNDGNWQLDFGKE